MRHCPAKPFSYGPSRLLFRQFTTSYITDISTQKAVFQQTLYENKLGPLECLELMILINGVNLLLFYFLNSEQRI